MNDDRITLRTDEYVFAYAVVDNKRISVMIGKDGQRTALVKQGQRQYITSDPQEVWKLMKEITERNNDG